ncbi:MAG: hypothetical protein HQL06_17125 [Nitrospirae bacterium]|nr:hypothetical protein [Nitrospirota bacterium]
MHPGAVQTESSQTTHSMNEASDEVKRATQYITEVGSALHMIVEANQEVSDQIRHIAVAVDEQSAVSADVAKNIEQTLNIAREVETMSAEVMDEVNTIINISRDLSDKTKGFKLERKALPHF